MIPLWATELVADRFRYDRSSSELRAYLRDEYHSNVTWLHARVRPRSASLGIRFRRWIAARPWRREASSPVRTPAPSAASPRWLSAAESCPHLLSEDLGSGAGAKFLQCAACGAVLVVSGDRQWRIGRLEDATPSVLAEALAADPIPANCEDP